MPFIVLGIIVLLAGAYFLRLGVKMENKEVLIGSIALLIAGLVLTVIFGLFYRGLTLVAA